MGRAFFGFTTAPGLTTVDGAVWQRVATATTSRHFGSANAVPAIGCHETRFSFRLTLRIMLARS